LAEYVVWFQDLGKNDVERVGGKNASLGEMISNLSAAGVSVPGGFATTAEAFREFLEHNNLTQKINEALSALDVEDVVALAKTGEQIRQWVVDAPFQPALDSAIREAYAEIGETNEKNGILSLRWHRHHRRNPWPQHAQPVR